MGLKTTGDGSLTLHSERYGQAYHSLHGAVTESKHVFLEASGLGERLAAGSPSRVLEVGFGTGLNFWLSADAATATGTRLEYLSLEHDLLAADDVASCDYGCHLRDPQVLDSYLVQRADLPDTGSVRLQLAPNVTLRLLLGAAERQRLPLAWADAVYHDAFSPEANSELWTEEFLGSLVSSLKPGGILVSYSVKGEVRRTLERLGLVVQRLPGPPGGKRQMLRASRPR